MDERCDLFRIFSDLPWPRTARRSTDEQVRDVRRKAEETRRRAGRSIAQLREAAQRTRAHWLALRTADSDDIGRRVARMRALIDALPAHTAELRAITARLKRDLRAVARFVERPR
jgi:hypothetical protein